MTTWTRRPPYRLLGSLALLPALLLASACNSTHEAQSGETHFLRRCSEDCGDGLKCVDAVCTRGCTSHDACRALAEDASCETRLVSAPPQSVCELLCEDDDECSALGKGFTCEANRCRVASAEPGQPDASSSVCKTGCPEVYGYGEDAKGGCVDRGAPAFLSCDCNPAAAAPLCMRRLKDGTLWVTNASDEALGAGYDRCTLAEAERMTSACEFTHCANPPLSTCSLEATCADRGCDNLQYFADGCRRTQCSDDAPCAADERCVRLECMSTSACTVANAGPDETCGCGGPAACIAGGACNPVASAGPRGAWQQLDLIEGSTRCPMMSCLNFYELTPTGTLTIRRGPDDPAPKFVIVEEPNLTTVKALIDGPELRVQLRDGFACQRDNTPAADGQGQLRLQLETETLEQRIERCPSNSGEALGRLRQLLYSYF